MKNLIAITIILLFAAIVSANANPRGSEWGDPDWKFPTQDQLVGSWAVPNHTEGLGTFTLSKDNTFTLQGEDGKYIADGKWEYKNRKLTLFFGNEKVEHSESQVVLIKGSILCSVFEGGNDRYLRKVHNAKPMTAKQIQEGRKEFLQRMEAQEAHRKELDKQIAEDRAQAAKDYAKVKAEEMSARKAIDELIK